MASLERVEHVAWRSFGISMLRSFVLLAAGATVSSALLLPASGGRRCSLTHCRSGHGGTLQENGPGRFVDPDFVDGNFVNDERRTKH